MMNDEYKNYGFPVLTTTVCVECGNAAAPDDLRCWPHFIAEDLRLIHERLGFEVEERVMYISPNDSHQIMEYTGDGPWVDPGVDGAAAYPWLMMNFIVWVETRYVKKTDWKQV